MFRKGSVGISIHWSASDWNRWRWGANSETFSEHLYFGQLHSGILAAMLALPLLEKG